MSSKKDRRSEFQDIVDKAEMVPSLQSRIKELEAEVESLNVFKDAKNIGERANFLMKSKIEEPFKMRLVIDSRNIGTETVDILCDTSGAKQPEAKILSTSECKSFMDQVCMLIKDATELRELLPKLKQLKTLIQIDEEEKAT